VSLPAGTKLGVFEVSTLLGVGGMGEVYHARDTKLGRDVAIKILPAEFAHDRDRLARFQREARLLATLNHPNIAHIHDIQESNGVQYLVMELVGGTTLADRLKRGPLGLEEALKLFSQIADGLDGAHQQGVIHRDLKPANIKITDDGKASLLDFGLAKAMEPTSATDHDAVTSPWNERSDGKSREGQILGTPAYMSPEQARGKPVDKRTDIWAFGCCLYETLTGKRPFQGETGSDTLAAILKGEPDWGALPPSIPARLRELLESCLAKDPRDRIRDIGDARHELARIAENPIDGRSPGASASRSIRRWRFATAGVLVVAIGLGAATWSLMRSPGLSDRSNHPQGVTVLTMSLPPESEISGLDSAASSGNLQPRYALSPDGSRLVYVGGSPGQTRLYLRPMNQSESVPLPGTEGAAYPFFSPDGRSVGFSARGKLRRLRLGESQPVDLADVRSLRGASWGRDGMIYFADSATGAAMPINDGLKRVRETGGVKPESITSNEGDPEVVAHTNPRVLPDGKSVLFTVSNISLREVSTAILSLDTRQWKGSIIPHAHGAQYLPTGHLLFHYRGWYYAVRFDLDRLEVSGPRVPIVQSAFPPALSETGTFVHGPSVTYDYRDGPVPARSLAWVDRHGQSARLPQSPRPWASIRLAPDGRRVAAEIPHDRGADVWIYDLVSDTHSRLTFANSNMAPIWTPDASRVIYSLRDRSDYFLVSAPIDGASEPQRLHKSPTGDFPGSIHPDGRTVAVVHRGTATSWDIHTVSLDGGAARPLLDSQFTEIRPAFSPDGRWLAYESDETGQQEVFVRPYPLTTAKYQVSEHGGTKPLWSKKGDELFYRNETLLWSVPIKTEPAFEMGQHQLLFDKRFLNVSNRIDYDVSPDGERFLFVELNEAEANQGPIQQLTVVQNWFEELKRLVPQQ
jgi:serine/threonine-protein kinase